MRKRIQIVCKECGGTGLYIGFAEADKSAVVCRACHGTGCVEFEYDEFTGRKIRGDVDRVYDGSYGFGISSKDHTKSDGTVIRFSEFGCSYQDWLDGKEICPIKDLYCPYMWKNTGWGNEPLEQCKSHIGLGDRISDCSEFKNKKRCWDLYEEKMGKKF